MVCIIGVALPTSLCPLRRLSAIGSDTEPGRCGGHTLHGGYTHQLGVTTIYVPGGVTTTALLEYIGQKQVMMIGTGESTENAANLWVVSLRAGSPLAHSSRSGWNQLTGRGGSGCIEFHWILGNTGAGLLGEARQRVVNEMLVELSNGLIDPGLVPD